MTYEHLVQAIAEAASVQMPLQQAGEHEMNQRSQRGGKCDHNPASAMLLLGLMPAIRCVNQPDAIVQSKSLMHRSETSLEFEEIQLQKAHSAPDPMRSNTKTLGRRGSKH